MRVYTAHEQNEICLTKCYTKKLVIPPDKNSNKALGNHARWNQRNICYEIYVKIHFCFSGASRLFLNRQNAKLKFRESNFPLLPAHRSSSFSRQVVVVVAPDRGGVMPRESKSHSASPKDTPISASPRVRDERNITKRLSIFSFAVGILLPGEE